MRELIERYIQLHESVIPSWVKKAAKSKVVEGPNGNKAIAYEWKWMWDEVWSKKEDGLVSKKVSDWDNAMNCASCRRRIVHVYWVETKEGDILPYGGDHLHMILGYPRELKKSQLDKIKAKITTERALKKKKEDDEYRKSNYEAWVKALSVSCAHGGASAIRDAIMKFNDFYANRPKPRWMSDLNDSSRNVVWLFNKRKKLLMRGDTLDVDGFLSFSPGWKVENPNKIRAFLDKDIVDGGQ